MLLVVPNFHEVNSPRPPSPWLPLSVCPQGWRTVISGGPPSGLDHPISRLPQSMSLLGHFAHKSCIGLPGLCPSPGCSFCSAISCNKQFRLKFLLFSFYSFGMGFYVLWYIPDGVYSCPLGMRVVGYIPESVLFMVLNFLPSTLGNPHGHIWVFRWAFLTRWCFYACAGVPTPQIDATHLEQMPDRLSLSWFKLLNFLLVCT